AETYYWRGLSLKNLRKYDEAIRDFTDVIRLDPNHAEAYRWRGVLRWVRAAAETSYSTSAIATRTPDDFQQALRLAPKWSGRNESLRLASFFTDVLCLDPGDPRAYLKRGEIYLALGWPGWNKNAVDDFTKAIQLDPKYAEAYHLRGTAYE